MPLDEAVRDFDNDDVDMDNEDFDIDIDIDNADDDDDMREDRDGQAPPDIDIPPEVQAEPVTLMLKKYYRKVLSEPVPMLGNIAPRDAARTPSGRAKLVEWLQHLEAGSAVHRTDGNPLGTYDFGWMWAELGFRNRGRSQRRGRLSRRCDIAESRRDGRPRRSCRQNAGPR